MPPKSPGIFTDAAGPSNYPAAGVATGNNTAGPSSLPMYPPPRPVYSAPVPAPAPPPPPPVNPSLVPAQMPPPRMYPYQGPQRRPVMPQGLFPLPRRGNGMPRRGTGPIMLNFQQPQAGDRFTGKASVGASAAGRVGASSYVATSLHHSLNPGGTVDHNVLPAMVPMRTVSNNPPVAPHPQQQVGVGSNVPTLYNNNYNAGSLVAPQQAGAGHGVAANLAAAAAAMEALGSDNYNNNAASLVAPQDDDVPAFDLAAFEAELNSDDFSNYTDGSLMASPDQVLGMASDLNDLITMAGGASATNTAASPSMAPPHQDLVVPAPNANQIPRGAVGNDDIDASLIGPQGPVAAVDDGNDNAGLEAMFADAEQNEENLYFQLDDLLADPDDAPTYEARVGDDSHQMGSGTSGAAVATADDAAATSLIGGGSSKGIWNIDVEDFEMVDDFVPNGTAEFMFRMA
ncbi:unnamed protein product [Urochloa humidicola]